MSRPNDNSASLYLTHRASLVDYATPIVGDRARAEEVVQEAFIRFAPGPRSGGSVEQPIAYLYRIVRNLALDWARRRAVEHRQQESGTAWWMTPSIPRTPDARGVRNLLDAVAPGGTLLVVSHDLEPMRAPIDTSSQSRGFDPDAYVRVEDVKQALVDRPGWKIEVDEKRPRPGGSATATVHVDDIVLRARRVA